MILVNEETKGKSCQLNFDVWLLPGLTEGIFLELLGARESRYIHCKNCSFQLWFCTLGKRVCAHLKYFQAY